MEPDRPAPPIRKTPDQILREQLNELAVSLVRSGFDAIDQAAEHGKNYVKKAIIKGMSAPRKPARK